MKKLLIIIYVSFWPLLLLGKGNNEVGAGNTYTVVIDAGHGGKDDGASGTMSKEKNIALAIALKTGKYISELLPEVKVVYTRTTDIFVPLHERAQIANDANAQLFISIHVNSNDNTKAFGTSSHVLGLHRTGENFEVAKRENSVILMEDDHSTRYQNFDPNSPESYIIFSVLQNIYLQQSIEIAAQVQGQFKNRVGRRDRGVMQQGLLVLAQTSMPGLLIETGFISNPNEEKYLMSEQGQDYIASAIFRAFRDYKNSIESKSEFQAANNNVNKKNEIETVKVAPENYITSDSNKEVLIVESYNRTEISASDNSVFVSSGQLNLNDKSIINGDNIIYKIQISSSLSKLDVNAPFFRGIKDIEIIESDGIYKYIVGNDTSYNAIKDICDEIKKIFPDAFIIAIKQGKIISMQQALSEGALKNKNIN